MTSLLLTLKQTAQTLPCGLAAARLAPAPQPSLARGVAALGVAAPPPPQRLILPCAAAIRTLAAKANVEAPPKRPASAWIRFLADYRARHQSEADKDKNQMRLAGTEWAKMNLVAKAPYVNAYTAEMEEYNRKVHPKKAAKSPDAPKRPATPWLRFLADYRAQHKDKDQKAREMMKAAATEWGNLSLADKAPYEKAYAAEQEEYRRKLLPKVDPEKPKQPMTPYMKFMQAFRVQHPAAKLVDAAKAAGATWKVLSDAEKAPYVEGYDEEHKKHKEALEDYKKSGKEAAWKAKLIAAGQAPKPRSRKAAA